MIKFESKIPVLTWNHLKVNEFTFEKDTDYKEYKRDIYTSNSYYEIKPINEDACYGYMIEIKEGKKASDPIFINTDLTAHDILENIYISSGKNSEATIIMNFTSDDNEISYLGKIKIIAKEGSKLNLIKIQNASSSLTYLDTISSDLLEDSSVNMVDVELGGKNVASKYEFNLKGKNSSCTLDTIYLGRKNSLIDLNYVTNLIGDSSSVFMDTRGVLMSGASKTYRGTIDFKTGAKGANGSEEETVMLLGEDIINKSVPLLLCTEDDVNGAHSTSVGKIDEDKLFYLMAKGLTEQEAKRLLIEASILPILDKIPDDALKENILNAFREMIL